MNSVLRIFLGTTVLAGTAFAQVDATGVRAESQFDIPFAKPQDATSKIVSITHHRTGKTVYMNGHSAGSVRTDGVVAYDTYSNPDGDPNGPVNYSYSKSTGELLCAYPLDPNDIFFTGVFAQGAVACNDPNSAGFAAPTFASFGIIEPLQILWDDYTMDSTVVGPNELAEVCAFRGGFLNLQGTFGTPTPGSYLYQKQVGWFENFDVDGDGLFEQTDGFTIAFQFDPNDAPGGVFFYDVTAADFDPNLAGFEAYGSALLLSDVTDVFFDPISGLPSAFACGVGDAFAGGGDPATDPNCTPVDDLYTAGSSAVDLWIFASGQGDDPNGPPWDPNFPVDSSVDGDPNVLTYVDLLNAGLLINLGYFDADTNRDLNSSLARIMEVVGESNPCGASCQINGACADTDLDGDVDLTDLANVLANFGGAGAGDTDGDGDVDLTDLANVLALFGAVCP